MSRAFVKEPDEGAPADALPERAVSEHPNYVTPTGLRQLEAAAARLEARRQELLERGDDPGGELDHVSRDLRYYAARLATAIPVDMAAQPRRTVAFGAAVTVSQPGGDRRTFMVVGEDEADLRQSKISYVSPLAEALLNSRVGETVLWRRPAGDLTLTVEEIAYPED